MEAGSLKANPDNWRKHPAHQVAALRESIADVGWAGALLFNERTNRLIDGHARRDNAEPTELVPVLVGNWDAQQERRILATLDPITALAEPDPEALGKLLEGLTFDGEALAKLGQDLAREIVLPAIVSSGNDESIPDLPSKSVTECDDLWIIGRHRVRCGDARKTEDVSMAMGHHKRADCVLTDPPYGIDQPGVPPDTAEEHAALIRDSVKALPIRSGVIAAFQSTRTFTTWLDETRAAGFHFERMLSLYKEAQMTYPWRGWILKTESILLSSCGRPHWSDVKPYVHDAYRVLAVCGELDDESQWHGSVKPLIVVKDLLSRISNSDDIVFDPFLGTGTTLIAAEQLGRKCYGIEIEPKYCDLIIERWQNLTGGKAKLVKP